MDRLSMHPYFIFKDAITVFVFLILFCFFVFFSPNTLGQGRPLLIVSTTLPFWGVVVLWLLILQYAICWKYLYKIYYKTIYISGLLLKVPVHIARGAELINNYANPILVKYYNKEYNQQITKFLFKVTTQAMRGEKLEEIKKVGIFHAWGDFPFLIKRVGISETTSIQKYIKNLNKNEVLKNENKHFNEWLGGLIDGDGSFGITQKKYTNCEITVGLEDEKMLKLIQNKFGGSIKLRSGSNSIRYRLQNKMGMINLINAVNGNIRNTKRLVQLNKICIILDIEMKRPLKLDLNNSWFSGFFDADGTINYYLYDERPQLFISVTNKYLVDIEDYEKVLGGKIYFDKSQNGYYKWVITNEKDHNVFYEYIKRNPSKSFKGNKIFMIPNFYKLYNLKGFKKENKLLYKVWLKFSKKWNNYSYKFK